MLPVVALQPVDLLSKRSPTGKSHPDRTPDPIWRLLKAKLAASAA